MKNDMPITKDGLIKIEEELDYLVKIEREDLKKVIQEARELGDLKENAEYHAAKEKQAQIEGRIMQLQGIVANAKVINVKEIKSDKIVFGATVTLFDLEKETTIKYTIVGEAESEMKKGKISYKSPLGTALIGKEQGDVVIVKAPKGDIEYEIQDFSFV